MPSARAKRGATWRTFRLRSATNLRTARAAGFATGSSQPMDAALRSFNEYRYFSHRR